MSDSPSAPRSSQPSPTMEVSEEVLNAFTLLCHNLAWGSPADEDSLFALTRDGDDGGPLTQLAEAFGMMIVKVEAREFHRTQLIEALQAQNAELEEARNLLGERNSHLIGTLQKQYSTKRIIGHCESLRAVTQMALSISRRPINTLILGPTGAGKEVIAKTIHYNSARRTGPFIAVNCTAIPDSLFESEMFGIERGVATGVNARKGMIEEAEGGTLFLDEIGDMSLPNQAKLLRVLEEREVMRVGSSKPVSVDIKIIAATNANLIDAVRAGKFRDDLYYRINVAEIRLPPLRERGDDVLLLAQHFLDEHSARMGRKRLRLSPLARACLMTYPWPGNVRELNNEMERAAALAPSEEVQLEDLSPRLVQTVPPEVVLPSATHSTTRPHLPPPSSLAGGKAKITPTTGTHLLLDVHSEHRFNLDRVEAMIVEQALKACDNNKSKAADLLGITREGLRKKLLRLNSLNSSDVS